LIDILVPRDSRVDKVRLKTDTNPFGSFSTTVVESRHGYLDPVVSALYHPIVAGENIRFVFKPATFTLSDSGSFWLKVVGVDTSNAEMSDPAPSAATYVHPVGTSGGLGGFNATAPVGVAATDAVRINLGRTVSNIQIRNLEAANSLRVSYGVIGSETVIPAATESEGFTGSASTLYLRGVGGTAAFSVRFSLAVK
jgi:hypothetical protein